MLELQRFPIVNDRLLHINIIWCCTLPALKFEDNNTVNWIDSSIVDEMLLDNGITRLPAGWSINGTKSGGEGDYDVCHS